jgi:hypothetical protein
MSAKKMHSNGYFVLPESDRSESTRNASRTVCDREASKWIRRIDKAKHKGLVAWGDPELLKQILQAARRVSHCYSIYCGGSWIDWRVDPEDGSREVERERK